MTIFFFYWQLFCFCSLGADVISFDGHSVIPYRFRSKKMKILKDVISLKFRTTSGNGVLLHGEGQQGDYISLELRRARLQLSINLGSETLCVQWPKCCLNMLCIFTDQPPIKLMPDEDINIAAFCSHIFASSQWWENFLLIYNWDPVHTRMFSGKSSAFSVTFHPSIDNRQWHILQYSLCCRRFKI